MKDDTINIKPFLIAILLMLAILMISISCVFKHSSSTPYSIGPVLEDRAKYKGEQLKSEQKRYLNIPITDIK